ncbi:MULTISPECIES: hypothetical protein [Amycolatopsis]|uniref:hypothetical protein n=1 Tax=Amycolatopsis TaxID=1813 RepID=UPI000B8A6836|nr:MULTISPECIES: hypothetical protein [Amycolatopsis]OXM68966.1 hypothetical protein CF166_22210 [Amycolatopsis sp. KNN50.9b]
MLADLAALFEAGALMLALTLLGASVEKALVATVVVVGVVLGRLPNAGTWQDFRVWPSLRGPGWSSWT